MNNNDNYEYRRLTMADVPAMEQLIRQLEWGQTKKDIEFLVKYHSASWGAFDTTTTSHSQLVSMASLPHFPYYSWLAYVATHEDHRHRGLATRLIEQLLQDHFQSTTTAAAAAEEEEENMIPIGLYGSVMGSPLYEKRFGFVDYGTAHLLSMTIDPDKLSAMKKSFHGLPAGYTIVHLSQKAEQVQVLDDKLFGAGGRPPVMDYADHGFAIFDQNQSLKGYVLARPMHVESPEESTGLFIGPLVGGNANDARLLLQAFIENFTSSTTTTINMQMLLIKPLTKIPFQEQDQHDFSSALIDVGFQQVSHSRLMFRGLPDQVPWIQQWREGSQQSSREPKPFAAAGYEFG